MTEPVKILLFENLTDARNYRFQHGTGGWIFEADTTKASILFPPHMPPTSIFHHPMTRGLSGRLIGNG